MDDSIKRPTYWVDELEEKHECGGYGKYSEPERIAMNLGGRHLTLISPFEFEPSRVLSSTFAASDDLLYLIAKVPRSYEPVPYAGLLVVARRREGDIYSVVVWHLLFGWALEYLGLLNDRNPDTAIRSAGD